MDHLQKIIITRKSISVNSFSRLSKVSGRQSNGAPHCRFTTKLTITLLSFHEQSRPKSTVT